MENEKFYIYGVNYEKAFKTDDGKSFVPVLMVNASPDSLDLGNDWSTAYLLSDQIDSDAVYYPRFVQQKDGSYKRKFRKES